MTSPLDFLYSKQDKQQDTTSATKPTIPKGDSSLNFLYEAPTQEPQQPSTSGFANYISNVAKNWTTIGAENTVVNLLDPIKRQELFTDPNAGNDLVHVFDHIFSAIGSGDPISISANTAIALGQKQKSEGVSAGGLATGLIKPIVDLGDLTSEINLESSDAHPLTPEEKTERLKSTAGLIVTSAIAGPVAGGLGATGNIFAKAAANTAIGGILGGVYGGIASANDPNQVASIITNGIMGGKIGALTTGIGVASGMLFGKRNVTPQEVQQVRQVQLENNTIPQAVEIGKNLMNADDLADVLLQGKIGLKPNDIHVIPGVSFAKIGELTGNVPEGYRSALHVDGDGVGRLLVYDDKLPIDEKFYEKNGFLKNQIVSYLGKEDWKVTDASGKMLKLENTIDGNKIDAHVNDVRLPANVNVAAKSAELTDRLYDDWKNEVEAPPPDDNVAQANNEKYGLIGFDETPPDKLIDKNPDLEDLNILKSMDTFLTKQGFDVEQAMNMKREFTLKLAKEAYDQLPPEDQAMVAEARLQYQRDTRTASQKIHDFKSLDRIARSNGYRVTDGGSGRWIIRSAKDGNILSSADNIEEARKWINKSGQETGPKLDDHPQVDTNAAGGGVPLPPSDPPKYAEDNPYDYIGKQLSKSNRGEDIMRFMDTGALWTRYRNYALEFDRKYGTKLAVALDNLQQKQNIRNFMARPHVDKLLGIFKTAKISPEEAEMVGPYIQAMTPGEVATRFMARPMNKTEINMAQFIANSGVDLEKVFGYQKELTRLEKEYPAEARSADANKMVAYQQQVEAAKQHFQQDDKALEVGDLLNKIEEHPKNEISKGAVVELARSLNNGAGQSSLGRSDFAKVHNLSKGQINAALGIDAQNKELANIFGISPDRQLGGYLTHAKLFFDGDIPKSIKHFSGDIKTREFVSKLTRTGEISALETNAFKAQLRYIKGGFDIKSGFADAITQAQKDVEEALKNIPPDAQAKVRSVMNRAIDDIRGFPEAGDRAGKEAVNYILDKFNKSADDATRRNWTNAVISLINAGSLGGRPMLGIGHFGISTVISYAARDAGYTARMLSNGAKALANKEIMEGLEAKGVFRGLAPYSAFRPDLDPVAFSSKMGAAIDKTQDVLFKATLLPTVYDGMAAGHYLTTYSDALEGLKAFTDKKITGKQLTDKLFLRRFDAGVARQFMDLAKTNAEDAAHYLGRQAIEDLVGTYGQGNTPYLWGTNLGRIVGQFGNYAMWIRGTLQRMLSRGSTAERWGSVAKLTGAVYLSHKISDELGVDVTRLSPVHAITWMFGPMVQVAEDAMDYLRSNGYQQQQALRRLSRVLPINPYNGNIQPSIFVPGSYMIDGIVQAADQFSQGNVGEGTGMLLGFRKFNAAKALEQGF